MSDDDIPAAGPQVGAYASIGLDDKLLLIADGGGIHVLPGGAVGDGEPVEQALQQSLLDQFAAAVAHLDFCAVLEHNTTLEHGFTSEVAFLFDVTLTDLDPLVDRRPNMYWWAGEPDLTSPHHEAIRGGLVAGAMSADNSWWAWTL